MTHGDSLLLTIEATQRSLEQRLHEAVAPHHDPARPRDTYAATDAFLAATSRHLAAVEAVLLDPVRHAVPEGETLVRGYLELVRGLEHTLALLKARLYGEAHAIHLDWAQLWVRVQAQLADQPVGVVFLRLLDEQVAMGCEGLPDEFGRVQPRHDHAHPLVMADLCALHGKLVLRVRSTLYSTAQRNCVASALPDSPAAHPDNPLDRIAAVDRAAIRAGLPGAARMETAGRAVSDAQGAFELLDVPRRHVNLSVGGEGLVWTSYSPPGGAFDERAIEIEVERIAHVRLDFSSADPQPDTFRLLDEAGEQLMIESRSANGRSSTADFVQIGTLFDHRGFPQANKASTGRPKPS